MDGILNVVVDALSRKALAQVSRHFSEIKAI